MVANFRKEKCGTIVVFYMKGHSKYVYYELYFTQNKTLFG